MQPPREWLPDELANATPPWRVQSQGAFGAVAISLRPSSWWSGSSPWGGHCEQERCPRMRRECFDRGPRHGGRRRSVATRPVTSRERARRGIVTLRRGELSHARGAGRGRPMSIDSAGNPLDILFAAFNGFQRTAALKAAIDLDLFTGIGEGHTTPSELAER